ncbi:MAG: PAS domain-containing protein [Chloroflexi bacterium]|nr:PAS domain-containing protein [Chloroflexota bacterium]
MTIDFIARVLAVVQALWQRLTEPAAAVTDTEQRQQSRLLAAILLVALLGAAVITLLPPLLFPEMAAHRTPRLIGLGITLVVLGSGYLLARSGRYRLAAALSSVYLTGLFIALYLTNAGSTDLNPLYYLIAAVFFASLFLPLVAACLLLAGQVVALLALILLPTVAPRTLLTGPLVFTLVLGSAAVLTIYYRRRQAVARQMQLEAAEATRQRLLAQLEQQARTMDVVLATTPDPVVMLDSDGRYQYLNRAAAALLDQPPDAVIGKLWENFALPASGNPRFRELVEQVIATGKPCATEIQIGEANARRILETVITPIPNEAGQVESLVLTNHDITARKAIETSQQLLAHEREQRMLLLSELLAHTPDSYVMYDQTGLITYASPMALKYDGRALEQLLGQSWGILDFPPAIRVEFGQFLNRVLATGQTITVDRRLSTADGPRDFEMILSPLRDGSRNIIGAVQINRDIAERKRAEAALRTSEERYRIISELISDYAYVFAVQPDGSLQTEWITDSFEQITGFNLDEIRAQGENTLFHPEDRPLIARDIEENLRGISNQGEYRVLTKHSGIRWLQIARRPVWDDDEKRVVRLYGVARDVTEHKMAEQQRLRLRLQRDQLQLTSQFVVAVSHAFRTALANIETSRYLIERRLPDELRATFQPKLDIIRSSADHLGEQIENLTAVSSLGEPQTDRCALNTVVDAVVSEWTYSINEKHLALTMWLDPRQPTIRCDREEIARALRHLLKNAVSYTPQGGAITIRTDRTDDHAIIEVKDTGIGIQPANLSYIFDLFYREDAARSLQSGGVGVGLSIVRMIVEAHEGRVDVSSTPGQGTTFTIRLPLPPAETYPNLAFE